jgi:hypothetical protein
MNTKNNKRKYKIKKVLTGYIVGILLALLVKTDIKGETITGVLRFIDQPQSLPSTTIYVYKHGDYKTPVAAASTTEATFSISVSSNNIYDIKAVASGYAEATLSYIVVKPGQNVHISLPLVPVESEIILDDADTQVFSMVGSWSVGSYGKPWGTGYHFATAGAGEKVATWRPYISRDSTYDVYIWWVPGDNRATNAPYTVVHADGEDVQYVNQTLAGEKWVKLGTYRFKKGTEGYIKLTNNANNVVIADAVKLVNTAVKTPPGIPQKVISTAEGSKIKLSWSPPTVGEAIGYKVYRSTSPGAAYNNANKHFMPIGIDIFTTEWTDENVIPGVWYYYAITAFDRDYTESSPSYEVSEIVSPRARVDVSVAPNKVKFASEEFETPVKVAVKLSGVEKGDLFIKIYTINGELVEILANNEKILEGEEKTFLWKGGKKLSSGVYIVHVNVNGNSKIQKIFLVK